MVLNQKLLAGMATVLFAFGALASSQAFGWLVLELSARSKPLTDS